MTLTIEKFVTIEDVMAATAADYNSKQEPRNYIGASMIGSICDRQIWYAGNGTQGSGFDTASILRFIDGHTQEAEMARRLRLLPEIRLYTHDADGKQFGFDLGVISGHVDGIIEGLYESSAPHIWEHKSVNEDDFKKLKKTIEVHGEKKALRFWNHKYFCQAQIYMRGMSSKERIIDRHYMTVSTPGGRDFTALRTEYEAREAEALIAKATRIAMCRTPPERVSNRPDFFMCKHLCQFKDVCHSK